MKAIYTPSYLTKELGVVETLYDRGTVLVKIKRDCLRFWRHGLFWYEASVFAPNLLTLHFRVADFIEFLFNSLTYEKPSEKEPVPTQEGPRNA